ncbi:MAG: cytochrome c3 family protein [Desulfobacterales bacterium]
MKKTKIILFSLTILLLAGAESYPSWLIDAAKFHVSAHGQNSCQDCHENIFEKDLHPNPEDVSKELADFFSVDQCLACHDEIMDNLEDGRHGSEKVTSAKDYEFCLECHDPHYQLSLPQNAAGPFDPAEPIRAQCGACHEHQSSLPPFFEEDEKCMACHRDVDPEDPKRQRSIMLFCFHCHSNAGTQTQEVTATFVPLIDETEYKLTPHSAIDCTSCHSRAAEFNHAAQKPEDCRQCHTRHDEKKAHDAHLLVACQACHLEGIQPVRENEAKAVVWERVGITARTSQLHQMKRTDDETICRRCHFKGNELGAASLILPAKSIMCMPCHAATVSVGDFTTIVALLIFLAGLVLTASVWFSGSMPLQGRISFIAKPYALLRNAARSIFSAKLLPIMKTLFFDVLLQRRLYRRSAKRWFIHSLIFYPIVFRFIWGIAGLVASLWLPDRPNTWVMLDKNHPFTAFLFDLTGIMILSGIIMAFLRGRAAKSDRPSGLPEQDRWALGLIGGIVIVGFFLEGIRIGMTGWPAGSGYALLGYGLSKVVAGMPGLTDIYGYVWYIHAVLTGAFIAYLPFSRLMHIIMAPVVLAMNAASGQGTKQV